MGYSKEAHLKKQARLAAEARAKGKHILPKDTTLQLDAEIMPMIGSGGYSVSIKYPKEYDLINSMNVKQSATFLTSKLGMINGIRTNLHKFTKKKFLIKKIDGLHSRIWRVADNMVIRPGGVEATKRAVATNKSHKQARKKDKRRGPKLTHKDGTPIVPVVNHTTHEIVNS